MALGGICAASEAGVRIAMGERVAHMLLERIAGAQLPWRHESRQSALVVRQSTAPPR
jgi:DNA-binding LacI/PurR family transcriptional regulator